MSTGSTGARPWGSWATIGLTLVIVAIQIGVQAVVAGIYLLTTRWGASASEIAEAAKGLQMDGDSLGLAMIVSAPVAVGFAGLVAWLRKGPRLSEYLALRPVSGFVMLRWVGYTLALMVALALTARGLGFEQSLDWMVDMYRNTAYAMVLVFALVVAAPVVEELVFRGFFYEGLKGSRFGPMGAILFGSLAWSGMHIQYDWFFMGQVFLLGLLFGAARYRTDSLWVPITMHAFNNGIAVAMLAAEAAAAV